MKKRIISWLTAMAILLCAIPSAFAAQPVTDGSVSALPGECLDYPGTYIPIRQFACEEAGGIYFLRDTQLYFLDMETGEMELAYTFSDRCSYIYERDNLLYWARYGTVTVFDLELCEVVRSFALEDSIQTAGIGVDSEGRIYLSVYQDSKWYLKLYSADGVLLDQRETEGQIYEFAGFSDSGEVYYVGYHNWVYWGYDHSMRSLLVAKVSHDAFCEIAAGYDFALLDNLCQLYYYEYQDNARVFDQSILADKNGNVYDISQGYDNISTPLYVAREYDEALPSDTYDTNSIGVRMLYNQDDGTIIAYSSDRLIWQYDLSTGEQLRNYRTQHYVFNLLEYGDSIVAIEKEGDAYYIERFSRSDMQLLETVTIDLNETDTYKSHTLEAVKERWEDAYIPSDTPIYASGYSLDPYTPAVYTDEMQRKLLDYSNYLRWLGGLTPFASAPEDVWTDAGKGTVLLTAVNELTHSPSQPADMDDAFYSAAYDACAGSNLYSGGISTPEQAMSKMVGWLSDTANISDLVLGHRFNFLQRAGYQIAYGSSGSYAAQTVNAYNSQENTTGTIYGVDNNDYCYTWPGAGYFPTNAINTQALWSINLNSDLIDLSNTAMTVTVTDLDTGEVYDQTDSIGSSAYYGFNSYFSYFYGECFYFDPPGVSSYEGKNYQVTVSNLQLSNGQPAEITYTVHFCSLDHSWDNGTVTLEPTTTTWGERSYSCTECGTVKTESIPMICAHPYTRLENAVNATCTTTGYSGDRVCTACGVTVETGSQTAKTSHTFGLWGQAQAGKETRKCSVCGAEETRDVLQPSNPFVDVDSGAFYKDAVAWAVKNGITNGTSATTFSPNQECNRAQVVTFLWRAAGSPEPTSTYNPFIDVPADAFYYKAVLWAVEKGITNGTSLTTFSPSNPCTRGQVVTFLWRAQGQPGVNSTSNSFRDVSAKDYFYSAVLWALDKGVTNGVSATQFAPNNTCSRGQIVTFLYRAMA